MFRIALFLVCVGLALRPDTLWAGELGPIPECDAETGWDSNQVLSAAVQSFIIGAQESLDAGNPDAALLTLGDLGGRDDLTDYDQVVIQQLYARAYLDRKLYEDGIGHLEQVVALGCGLLAPEQIRQMIFNAGQIYVALGAENYGQAAQSYYRRGIKILEAHFHDNPNARPDAFAMLAVAYLQVEPRNDLKAIAWLQKAIDKAQELNETPKEGWYRNLAQLYLAGGQPAKALPILQHLVRVYGKRDYRLQLSVAFEELGRGEEQYQTLVDAYENGKLEGVEEFSYLIQLHLANGNPEAARTVLEVGKAKRYYEPTASLDGLIDK